MAITNHYRFKFGPIFMVVFYFIETILTNQDFQIYMCGFHVNASKRIYIQKAWNWFEAASKLIRTGVSMSSPYLWM